MGRLRFAPYIFGVAAALVFAANPVDVQAIPMTTANSEITFGDLDIQGKIIYTATEEVASPFYKKGISTATDCVMIRKEPNVDSEAVGKLYADAGFEVIEEAGEWLLIKSGSCEGYVYSEYVVTGKKAEELAAMTDGVYSYAKIVADDVVIKAAADDDAEIIATVNANDVIDVVSVIPETEWTKVVVNGVEGFVKSQSVEVCVDYTSALTMEEDAARAAELEAELEEERKADEEVEKEEETSETETADTDVPEETETEVETEAEEETEAEDAEEEPEEETETEETETEPVYEEPSYSVEERWETVWATETVNIRSDASSSANKVGSLSRRSSITRTGVCDNGWSRVEYDGSTAYIHSDYLTTEEPVVSSGSDIGQQIVDYARQFLGNPYVYGGTSLTNGADCSGFVQTIFRDFGYSISRTCTTQSRDGRAVSVDELQPGDIIIFAADGYNISHVAIYSGNGKTIHASTWSTGIIETSISYSGPIYCCRRIAE